MTEQTKAQKILVFGASGLIGRFVTDDLRARGFHVIGAAPFAAVTSLMDISIGVLIAFRRSCAAGLIAGILLSRGYMAGTAILTPDLWIEPLGALVKTGPAIVPMIVALLTLDNR
jgi:hypothetical protein